MGRFVNPDNAAFAVAVNSEIYIDKTGLLEYTNKVLNTKQALICNSRPRRFGKSITADMLTAYYSKGCQSADMFAGYQIASKPGYQTHMNQYDVIHFDVQWCITPAGGVENVVAYINRETTRELQEQYPEIITDDSISLPEAMSRVYAATGNTFIVIIDEWDVLIRDAAMNQAVQEEYINFLRGMFKGVEPTKYLSLAYLTGILPIKRLRTQSALNNFDEFTMLAAGPLAPYVGFTEEEVKELCDRYHREFAEVQHWYDGYILNGHHIYNPKAVVSVMLQGEFQSYWSQTGTYEMIVPLINMDFDGLRTAIIEMLSGASVEVEVQSFQNDMVSFAGKDDVLTLLIHLGYLAYNQRTRMAWIPNEEIRQEFLYATKKKTWNELREFENASMELLDATLDMDAGAVAEGIEKIHAEYASAIQYNNENSLTSTITIGYLAAVQYYFKPIREFPTGRGFADIVYIPKPEYAGSYPLLVVELKWNQSADTAIKQIKEKRYAKGFEAYTGDILLVGIDYDKKSKEHQCVIEKVEKE